MNNHPHQQRPGHGHGHGHAGQPNPYQQPQGNPYAEQPHQQQYPGSFAPHQQQQPGYGHPQGYPYGQQQPGYQGYAGGRPTAPDNGTVTTVFILGLLGLFFAITAPIAWIMGSAEKKRVESLGYAEPGLNAAGRIMGIIVTVICLVVFGLIFFLILMASAAAV